MRHIICLSAALLAGTAVRAVAQPAPPSNPLELPPPADEPAPGEPPPTEPVIEAPPPAPIEPVVVIAPVAEPAVVTNPLTVNVFADAQYVLSTRRNNPVDATGNPIPQPGHRAWERNNGFALSWVGLDAVYEGEKWSATTSLRFGSSVVPYYAASTTSPDLDGIAAAFQAFGTWKPNAKLAVDVGRFYTIYGAEVLESWRNINYTRGALYYAFQPFFHTGVRAAYLATPELKLTGMVVNGVNNAIDGGKERPSLGLQGSYTKGAGTISLGYLGSTDPNTDFFDHFVDLVATYSAGKVAVAFNADFIANRKQGMGTDKYFGASLAGGYTVDEHFRLGLRAETLVSDSEDTQLYTGTFTLDYRPLGNAHVVIRLDNRLEGSDQQIFIDRDAAPTKGFFQSVLGFVVTSS